MALLKVGVTMCLMLSKTKFAIFRPLNLEDQIIFFTHSDFDVLVCVKEDPSELISRRRVLAIVINLCFFSRCILEYNLSSLVECDAELLTAESGTSLTQEDIANLWITFKHKAFLEVLRFVVKGQLYLRHSLAYSKSTFST